MKTRDSKRGLIACLGAPIASASSAIAESYDERGASVSLKRLRYRECLPIARNLTDFFDGFLRDKRYLILDNDSMFTVQFKRILEDAGVEVVPASFQAPDMNSIARAHERRAGTRTPAQGDGPWQVDALDARITTPNAHPPG